MIKQKITVINWLSVKLPKIDFKHYLFTCLFSILRDFYKLWYTITLENSKSLTTVSKTVLKSIYCFFSFQLCKVLQKSDTKKIELTILGAELKSDDKNCQKISEKNLKLRFLNNFFEKILAHEKMEFHAPRPRDYGYDIYIYLKLIYFNKVKP